MSLAEPTLDADLAARCDRLAQSVLRHAPREGLNLPPVEGVCVYRAHHRQKREPVVYDPCIVIVVQGAKRGYHGRCEFRYDSSTYLTFALPLPIEAEIVEASPERPFLCMAIALDLAEVTDLVLELGEPAEWRTHSSKVLTASPLTDDLRGAVERLVTAMDNEADARVLGPMARREILYRVLMSEQGASIAAMLRRHGNYERIGTVMRRIHEDCAAPISTEQMAAMAGMSKTVLHETFKSVTTMTPLQYVKSIRLHRARLLMLNEGLPASAAGFRVGYASASQFSREFKRFFGTSPSQSLQALGDQGENVSL